MVKLISNALSEVCVLGRFGNEIDLRTYIKKIRQEAGLSPGNLETKAAVYHPVYLNFENGKTKNLNLPALVDILDALGYDLILEARHG